VIKLATLVELKSQMDAAFEKGDMKEVAAIARAMKALGDETRKAELDKVAAEYDKVSVEILDALKATFKPFWKRMEKVGLSKRIYVQLEGKTIHIPPQRKKGGGGGGGAGATKTKYGLSLGEVFEQFATPEERAEFDSHKGDGNKTWAVKDRVKKRAIAEGLLTPQA